MVSCHDVILFSDDKTVFPEGSGKYNSVNIDNQNYKLYICYCCPGWWCFISFQNLSNYSLKFSFMFTATKNISCEITKQTQHSIYLKKLCIHWLVVKKIWLILMSLLNFVMYIFLLTLTSILSINCPLGMVSIYLFKSIDKNSNTKYNLFSCINTSSKLKQIHNYIQNNNASEIWLLFN